MRVCFAAMPTPPADFARVQSLVSIGQIAAQLGRNPASVYRAIMRLEIQPALILPVGGSRYDPAVVDLLGASMRRPNYSQRASA